MPKDWVEPSKVQIHRQGFGAGQLASVSQGMVPEGWDLLLLPYRQDSQRFCTLGRGSLVALQWEGDAEGAREALTLGWSRQGSRDGSDRQCQLLPPSPVTVALGDVECSICEGSVLYLPGSHGVSPLPPWYLYLLSVRPSYL